jgi:hypothetical protein
VDLKNERGRAITSFDRFFDSLNAMRASNEISEAQFNGLLARLRA